MLAALTIKDVVLIDQLTLEFGGGLCVMTGETGAGKSILLDSLGLAMGARADAGLVRTGSLLASVTAEFNLAAGHPVFECLATNDISGDGLVLRRILKADGSSRAFINDQPVSAGLLRDVGNAVLEIHGQHDDRGLLNAKGHRALLDAFCGHDSLHSAVGKAWGQWRETVAALDFARAEIEVVERDRDYLEHAVAELGALLPEPDEETTLADRRGKIMRGEKIGGELESAGDLLSGSDGALAQLRQAARKLERVVDADASFKPMVEALDRAIHEASDAEDQLYAAQRSLQFDPAELDRVETRLFDLRGMARKYRVTVGDLPKLHADMAAKYQRLLQSASDLSKLEKDVTLARTAFISTAEKISASRQKFSGLLDKAVASELAPLKLDKAKFRVSIEPMAEHEWGPEGVERVQFEISTNPGAPFAPLIKIASGGELSRFILALKVALVARGSASTLIFDEIDRGVGGAVASAIGDRLARLATTAQVIVVTHSPQVAAAGASHWLIAKNQVKNATRTTVNKMDQKARREEIARMLSGDTVTEEARAQASKLLATGKLAAE
jgi:DNA repair protein RecN (Recombination protein N)